MAMGVRCVLGGVFLYAGIMKLRDTETFAAQIAAFELLPAAGVSLIAGSLPLFEIFLGALLITGWQRRAAALGAMLLSAGFAAAIGSALARGLELDCGCFGKGTPSAANLRLSLGRDAVFFAMAAWLYFRERRPAANKNPKLRRTGQSPARLDSQNESINP